MLDHLDLTKLVFGRLSWEAIPCHEPILLVTFIAVVLGGVAVLGAITYFRAVGHRCGATGSPASTTRRSASCTSSSAW